MILAVKNQGQLNCEIIHIVTKNKEERERRRGEEKEEKEENDGGFREICFTSLLTVMTSFILNVLDKHDLIQTILLVIPNTITDISRDYKYAHNYILVCKSELIIVYLNTSN